MHKSRYQKFGINTIHDLTDFLDRDYVKQMIGKNYDFYRELWLSNYESVVMGEPKKSIKGRYNIFAFFFFPVWAAYRKLYYILGIFILLDLSMTIFAAYIGLHLPYITQWLNIFFWISYKDIYLTHLIKSNNTLDKIHPQCRKFKPYNGTNVPLGIIAFIAYIILLPL